MIILPKKKAEAAARNELARTKAKLAELMERIQVLKKLKIYLLFIIYHSNNIWRKKGKEMQDSKR